MPTRDRMVPSLHVRDPEQLRLASICLRDVFESPVVGCCYVLPHVVAKNEKFLSRWPQEYDPQPVAKRQDDSFFCPMCHTSVYLAVLTQVRMIELSEGTPSIITDCNLLIGRYPLSLG